MNTKISINSEATGLFRQFRRFAAVGLVSNLCLYGAYLFLTDLGVAPKIAMSALYAVGMTGTYVLNGLWSFGRARLSSQTFTKYLLAHGTGFTFNLGLLWFLVDLMQWQHQLVQALAIVLVAILLFILNRFWVFVPPPGNYT